MNRLIIVLLFLTVFLACNRAKESTPKDALVSTDPIPVEVCIITPESIEQIIATSGEIIAQMEVDIQPKIEGTVRNVFVQEGDRIKAGDYLLALEDQEIQARLKQAQANLLSYQSILAKLLAGERPEDIAAARARVEQFHITYNNEKADLDRWRRVKNEISPQALAAQETKTRVAKAILDAASTELRRMEQGPRLEDIESARADVASAHASLDLALEYVKSSFIRSTTDGLIINRDVEPGERIAPGTTVFRMVKPKPLWVRASIEEKDIGLLAPGLPCQLQVASYDRTFPGSIDILGGELDRLTRTMEVKITTSNDEELLKPGMFARITIHAGLKENILLLPRSAIRFHHGRAYVFVIRNGLLEERRIELGKTHEEQLEILTGLQAGEQVVTSDYGDLNEGTAVQIVSNPITDATGTLQPKKELSVATR